MRTDLKSAFLGARLALVSLVALLVVMAAQTAYAQPPTVTPAPGKPALLLGSYDVATLGYRSDEFYLAGTASSYQAPASGAGAATVAATAPYVTRIVVTRPIDARKFNGAVLVEWDNVSGGQDVPTEWIIAHREIVRSGYVHVAVSVQKVGIDGGPSLMGSSTPLKQVDPARYGRLVHPGDAFAYDIFSQAGSVMRGPNAKTVLGGLTARRVIAVGESQSATYLTTYVNNIDPLAKVFDGFLIHSRFGSAAALARPAGLGAAAGRSVPYRPDLRVPVLTVLTETDVLGSRLGGYYDARVPDNDRLRVWEIAGSAHADNYLFGLGQRDSGSLTIQDLAQGFAPSTAAAGGTLAKPANTGMAHHYVMQAAVAAIDGWLRTGRPPARGPVLTVNPGPPPAFAVDADGLVLGGVRTPWVDAPTARLSGNGNTGGPVAMLAGVTEPFDAAKLDRLYPGGKQEYLTRFRRSLDAAIRAGFLLRADRQEILDLAAAMYPGGR